MTPAIVILNMLYLFILVPFSSKCSIFHRKTITKFFIGDSFHVVWYKRFFASPPYQRGIKPFIFKMSNTISLPVYYRENAWNRIKFNRSNQAVIFFYETRTIDALDQAYLELSLVPIFPVISSSRPDLEPLGIRGWERTKGYREKPLGAV